MSVTAIPLDEKKDLLVIKELMLKWDLLAAVMVDGKLNYIARRGFIPE